MSGSRWIAVGALWAGLAVGLGAFGAHGLEGRVGERELAWWATATQYHLWHALALVLFGLFARARGGGSLPGWCFLLGSAVFAGTLDAMALGAPRWLGAVTPLGGVLMIAGWLAFARQAWRERRNES